MAFWEKDEETVESIRERRTRKMDRFMKMQVAPLACKVLFITMLVLPLLAVLSDVTSYQRYGAGRDYRHLLSNMAISAFTLWTIPALILIITSLVQLHRLKNGYEERMPEKLTPVDLGDNQRFDLSVFEEKKGRKRLAPEKKYRIFSAVAAIGIAVFGVLLILVSFI